MTTDKPCSITGCQRDGRLQRGMCHTHYERWRRNGSAELKFGRPETHTACSIEDCDRPFYALGFCRLHHLRLKRHGDTSVKLTTAGEGEAGYWRIFWSRVDADGDCWEWCGSIDKDGYGRFADRLVHRLAYEYLIGHLNREQTIDHICRNRRCVNMDHVEVVTSVENVMRGYAVPAQNARQTKCLAGHPFDYVDRYGRRRCSICRRRMNREHLARLRARRRLAKAQLSYGPYPIDQGDYDDA